MKNYSFIEKWGKVTSQLGFVSVPTALLFAQSDLRINALEMNVLMNLLMHWWDKDQYPYPSQKAIAFRVGVSSRTVQRVLKELEDKELIKRELSSRTHKVFKGRNVYNLDPLIEALETLTPTIQERLGK
ncbi:MULTISPECIES: helix-turn-helix domain-containing protein [Acinetobacter]|jgi:DNA-binding MarR family transcriptional regulator|uniref:Helix-turn-helix domain-containing protein n=1 Tax=Acinetobacter baumannii TaxID=470 RepID=A0AA90HR23_ACIBA|nr:MULTISPECIES: helix-turn-helix domain-containing protein [Acinetobacter]MBC6802410.1 helix-turn-helix domain-containing protein [Acinetobacter baumannii]MBC6815959.1 helix-turn-helix domain-containing protein [Acinetobacter baumannii]MCR4532743.1 helix-turn-helix domain-containing protein [Acinetobacter venetianus]MDC5051319.1 helix-turn-helix domain-containing protein [Acinetobacter baumannii]MEC5498919.1 helix-turn-helix domain-containing protein [Acinetobacter baumannii]